MSDHIEINIDTGDEVDELSATEFHDDLPDDGESDETEWTNTNETNELEVSSEAPAIEAAILVQEALQTEAEQEQAEAAQIVAEASQTMAQVALQESDILNNQLAQINSQLTVIMNLINPPSLESSATGEAPTLPEEVQEVTVTTVEAETPAAQEKPSEKAQPAKKRRKRSVRSLLKKR